LIRATFLNYEALFFVYVNETSLPKGIELRESGLKIRPTLSSASSCVFFDIFTGAGGKLSDIITCP